jgi:serine/threonine protein kinase
VVIKKLNRQVFDPHLQRQLQGGEPLNENPYAEISVMQQHGDYQRIFRCYEALWDAQFLYIVTLWARDGDLFRHICRGFPQSEVRGVARQLVRNLEFLQQRRLVHRDLKPENVVIAPPYVPFIDFAMTLQIPHLEGFPQMIVPQGEAGSPHYFSPEVCAGKPFDHKVDIWAFGCILFNLLTGLRLWERPREDDIFYRFFILQRGLWDRELCDQCLEELRLEELLRDGGKRSLPSILIQAVQAVDPEARNLLQKLWSPDPRDRPEVDEIINHPFFHGVA